MVTPTILQDPALRRWLGDIVPAWTLLDPASLAALRWAVSSRDGPLRMVADLPPAEISRSAITRNALVLLEAAAVGPGLKLTATGNLSRQVVAEMRDRFTWPDFDEAEAWRFHKVVNEPDFLLLSLIRHLVQAGRLVNKRKDRLKIGARGRQALEGPGWGVLQALLFHLAFWITDLSYFGRNPLGGWPQRDIGVVLWSLSVSANEWQTRERLTRMCTIPTAGILDSEFDPGTYAMEAIVLRPLLWFGLLEHRADPIPDTRFTSVHFYRKSPLFDQFLRFDAIKPEFAAAG